MTYSDTEDHRTLILSIRLTPAEHTVISTAAARATLPISSFVRTAALSLPITIKNFASLAPEDIGQLKRLGNLLNQIARAGWRGRFTPATDELLASVLLELRIALRKLSREIRLP